MYTDLISFFWPFQHPPFNFFSPFGQLSQRSGGWDGEEPPSRLHAPPPYQLLPSSTAPTGGTTTVPVPHATSLDTITRRHFRPTTLPPPPQPPLKPPSRSATVGVREYPPSLFHLILENKGSHPFGGAHSEIILHLNFSLSLLSVSCTFSVSFYYLSLYVVVMPFLNWKNNLVWIKYTMGLHHTPTNSYIILFLHSTQQIIINVNIKLEFLHSFSKISQKYLKNI